MPSLNPAILNTTGFTITALQYQRLQQYIVNNDRIGFYVALAQMTGSQAAMDMAEISSSSGIRGGAAWHVNYAYAETLQGRGYPASVEDFSIQIAALDFSAITLNPDGSYAVPSDYQTYLNARQSWNVVGSANGGPADFGERYFPGNLLLAAHHAALGEFSQVDYYLSTIPVEVLLRLAAAGGIETLSEFVADEYNHGISLNEFSAYIDNNPGATWERSWALDGTILDVLIGADGHTVHVSRTNLNATSSPLVLLDKIADVVNTLFGPFWQQLNEFGELLAERYLGFEYLLGSYFGYFKRFYDPNNGDSRPNFDEAENRTSPIIVDLDGDGVETQALSRDRYFDHDANGMLESTAWAGGDDGFLVRDINGNGLIDTGREMFGTNTVLQNGQLASNGYEALQELDSNQDGLINAADSAFSQLRIWRDADSDGVTDAGELQTLGQAGIASLSTQWTASSVVDSNGQLHAQVSSATRTNGTATVTSDVWFNVDAGHRINAIPLDASFLDVIGLPNAQAFGNLPDLRQSMAKDPILKGLVEAFIAEQDPVQREAMLEGLIFQWAGVADVDPHSRDPHMVYGHVMDARQLIVLEQLIGRGYQGTWCWGERDPNPHGGAAPLLIAEFKEFQNYVRAQLLAQIDPDHYSFIKGGFVSGFTAVVIDWEDFHTQATVLHASGSFEKLAEIVGVLRDLGTYSESFRSNTDAAFASLLTDFPDLASMLSNDFIVGGTNADILFGTGQGEVIFAAEGDDSVFGGDGDDSYYYRIGDGKDRIYDSGGADQLLFMAGIGVADITVTRDITAIIIIVGGNLGSLRIDNVFDENGHLREGVIESVKFHDGTVWTFQHLISLINSTTLASQNDDLLIGGIAADSISALGGDDLLLGLDGDDSLNGGDNNDTLVGGNGNDELTGGLGNDIMNGGAGSDTYVFDAGFGHDVIENYDDQAQRLDRVQFTSGISINDVTAKRIGNDLVLFLSNGDSLTVSRHFEGDGASQYSINEVRFSNGTTWNTATLNAEVLKATAGSDTLVGFASDDVVSGLGGNDVIDGAGGNDTLSDGEGNDVLRGGDGNDAIYFAAEAEPGGSDVATGDAGDDTYYVSLNSGTDRITGLAASNSGLDRVVLSGITTSMLQDYKTLGNDLYLFIGGSEGVIENTIILEGFLQYNAPSHVIEFAGGTTMTKATFATNYWYGTAGDDVNAGSFAPNFMDGGAGNDTLSGGMGDDYLSGGEGSDILHGNLGNDTFEDGAGDDILYGEEGDDLIKASWSEGGDQFVGGVGNDTYQYLTGFSTGAYNMFFSQEITELTGEGNDTVVTNYHNFTLSDTSVENLVVKQINYIYSTWDNKTVYRQIFGNELDNTIRVEGAIVSSVLPNILLDGGLGNDTLIGSEANEIYVVDSAGDSIMEPETSNSNDTVRSSISFSLEGYASIENVELTSNGTTATGNVGNNRLDGTIASGANTLIGGGGDDTYIVDSNDTVVEGVDGGVDTVVIRKIAAGTSVIDVPSQSNNIEAYQLHDDLGDNIVLNGSDHDDVLIGNSRASTLNGGAGNDELRSGGNSSGYSDYLDGGQGDDLLISGSGNVVLKGGLGNDEFRLSRGTENIRYEHGDGSDTVLSDNGNNSGVSTFQFGSSIDPDNVIWSREGNDLVLAFADLATDGVRIEDYWIQAEGVDALSGVIERFSFYYESGYRTGLTLEQLSNRPPARNYSTLETTAQTGQIFAYTLPVDAFSDESVESLVYSVDGLPDWLSFDPLARTFQGTPPLGQTSEYYQVTATDIYGASSSLSLHVSFVNVIQGTSGNDSLVGTSGVDVLIGLAGIDTLNGGADADQLIGGVGNDTYTVDNGSDQVIESFGEGDDLVNASDSYWLPENVERLTLTGSAIDGGGNELDNVIVGNGSNNSLEGNEGNDTLTGNNGSDALYGGSGNDTLDGGTGNDYMSGDEGDDTYIVGSTGDEVEEWEFSGTDTVRSSVTYTLGYEVENLVLTGSSGLTGNGNELDNVLTGNSGANTLRGYAGNDTLDGGTGNDAMSGGAGNDTYVVNATGDVVTELASEGIDLIQSTVTYTLGSNVENLTLTGTSAINGTGNTLNNVLLGNTGNNTLSGGAGTDTLVGGAGNDTYVVDNTGDVVTEVTGEGTDLVQSSVTYTLSSNVENLTLTGTSTTNGTGNGLDNVLTGNSGNNTLTGGAGNDTLNGGTGNDTMLGGADNDTYVVNATGDVVTELASEGIDLIQSTVTYTLGSNVENLTLTGTSAISATGNTLDNVLIGNSGNNTLTGGNGNDTLDGGVGNDTMVGGTGDDTYFVNVSSDVVTEQSGQGDDTVVSAITYTLSTNLEHLTLSGTTAINGTGNASNNRLTGNSGNNALSSAAGDDVLQGGAGTDTLTGGTGKDTYVMARGYGADTVVENDTASGQLDVARFLSGVSYDQLWFAKPSGSNNLEITIIGTGDVLIIKDWYLGSQYRVEEIRTADGSMLLTAAKVQDLVTAMASLTKPALGQTTLSPAYQSQLAAVFASTWTSTGGQGLLAGGGSEPALMAAKVAGTTVLSEDMTAGIMADGCCPTPREDRVADWLARVGDRANDGRIQAWLADHGYASIDEWLESGARPQIPHGNLPDRFEDRRYLDARVAMFPLENASVTTYPDRPGSPLAEPMGGSALLFPESLADLLASFEEQQTTSTDRLYQSVVDTLVQDRSPQWNGVLGEGQPDRSMQADAASSYQRLISAMSLAGVHQSSLGSMSEGHRNEPSLI